MASDRQPGPQEISSGSFKAGSGFFYLDFLHVVARGQNLSACLIGDGNVGNQTIIEGVLPDLWLGRQAKADLPVAVEKRISQEPLPIKTPPAISITDGAFELIFQVGFLVPDLPLTLSTRE
jgi:hypothetical protein